MLKKKLSEKKNTWFKEAMASALGNWDITLSEDMYIEKSCKIFVLILIRDRCLNYNIACPHVSLDYCGSYIGYRVQD